MPEPAELERYEKLLPGTTDRLLQSYEKQATHRMGLENKVIDGDSVRATSGQIFSFILYHVTWFLQEKTRKKP
ncbi:MAG: DUF2335 domain-containing protein [Peptostreptococcaceae bacterium]|nr:DUF2335 domain-containing protein [Peptostreptococcaceae bacterium]